MTRRNIVFAGAVIGAYALFLGAVIPSPVRYTGLLVAGKVTVSMLAVLVLIAAIVTLAVLYLRQPRSG